MRLFRQMPISQKIILSVVPLFVLFIGVSVVLQNRFQEQAMFEQARTSAATHADLLRESLVSMMITNQEVDSTFLDQLNSIPRFDSVRIIVNDLRLREELVADDVIERREYKDRAMAPVDSVQRAVLASGEPRFLWGGDRFRGVIPFKATKTCQRCHAVPVEYVLGASDLAVSYSSLSEAAEANWKRSVLIFLAFTLLVGALATLMFRRFVSSPISSLTSAAGRIGAGELHEPVTGPGSRGDTRDELAILAGQFDRMRESLKEKIDELDAANRALSERNLQLEDALRQLHDAQEVLVRTERLAATGRLTAQLSHEINNPIHNIQSLLESSSRRMPDDSPARELITAALDEIRRLARLTRQMLDVFRGSSTGPQRETVNVLTLVNEVVALHQPQVVRAGVRLAAEHGSPDVLVTGSGDRLRQVVINLILNALDAQPAGGEIMVRTRRESGRVVLEVSDRGTGIPPEQIEKVFDAFFTTKRAASGVGLGLTVCHGIVREHGGEIRVSSQLGQGTTFRIELPVRESSHE